MKIILLKSSQLGKASSIQDVKSGYGLYLIKSGIALLANDESIKSTQSKQLEIKQLEDSQRALLLQLKDLIKDQKFSISKQATDTGVLYGSVSKQELLISINSFLAENNIDIKIFKENISFQRIRSLGGYKVTLHYLDLSIDVFFDIIRA